MTAAIIILGILILAACTTAARLTTICEKVIA